MNVLFISYREVSLSSESVRAVAMLYALADAGHRVDLLAPYIDLPDHPHINVLTSRRERSLRPAQGRSVRRARLHSVGFRAMRQGAYNVVHAVDDAVFYAMRLCRWKRIPIVYDAVRCFGGEFGCETSFLGRLFPERLERMEARVLERAVIVFSPCPGLADDLRSLNRIARVVLLEEIPAQPLHSGRYAEKTMLTGPPGKGPGNVVVCCALPGHILDMNKLFLATRKVIEAEPATTFFFKGVPREKAEKIMANLDIASHCVFLSSDQPKPFLSALEIADANLLLPQGGGRYIHPQVYTLLHAGAPLVTLHEAAYDDVLTDKTSVCVLPNPESIAEGLLRVIREPLFSLALGLQGQQLVADRHTYSSFKHKVRMTYRDLAARV